MTSVRKHQAVPDAPARHRLLESQGRVACPGLDRHSGEGRRLDGTVHRDLAEADQRGPELLRIGSRVERLIGDYDFGGPGRRNGAWRWADVKAACRNDHESAHFDPR